MFISHEEAIERLRDPKSLFSHHFLDLPADPSNSLEEKEKGPIEKDAEKEEIDPKKLEGLNREILGWRRKRRHPEERAGIAEVSLLLGDTVAGQLSGANPSSAWSYKHAFHNSDGGGNRTVQPYLKERIDKARSIIQLRASSRLKTCLSLLDEDKIGELQKATELSQVAKDMAVILQKMDKNEAHIGTQVSFHIHKPEMRAADSYDLVPLGCLDVGDSVDDSQGPVDKRE